MTIAPAILGHFPDLNQPQRLVVGHLDGPLLVVAGPGSGKTYSIVLRALNLLLLGKAAPHEIVLCTFTEKAAFEMRDRLSAAAQKARFLGDLSELVVSTIHGLCNRLLSQHRYRTQLGHNYETLDELTQLLFIFDHFNDIIGEEEGGLYLGRWKTRWTAIEGARGYFDKITEELIEPQRLLASEMPFMRRIGEAYLAYGRFMSWIARISRGASSRTSRRACASSSATPARRTGSNVGWEWEMGLYDLMVEVAKKKGMKLLLLQIPREVMEQQAAVKGDVRFFELAYLELEVRQPKKLTAQVALKEFMIPNTDLIPEEIRSRVKKWSDYIDYWAVDWDFQNDTFMQGWVAYRTRKERKLSLISDPYIYEKPGKRRILVKVIDIFGNDTSQAFDVEVN